MNIAGLRLWPPHSSLVITVLGLGLILVAWEIIYPGNHTAWCPVFHSNCKYLADEPAGVNITEGVLLQRLTEECSKRKETWISFNATEPVVGASMPRCASMVMLIGKDERGWGMCMDAALYVIYADAVIAPVGGIDELNTRCNATPHARVNLETMHGELFSNQTGVSNLMLVNSEHMFTKNAEWHALVDLFLCKTQFCTQLMSDYITDRGLNSSVVFMGHTSADPSLGMRNPERLRDWDALVHVRGKSGLKHTHQTLACWNATPSLPPIQVLGSLRSPEAFIAPNIRYVGVADEEGGNLELGQVAKAQVTAGIHLCASEREGFGHYLNEARAVGAVIITTDHPPMNEFVTVESGILIPPDRTESYDWMSLGPYGQIIAFVTPEGICDAVHAALELPVSARRRLGILARAAYLDGYFQFVAKAGALHKMLKSPDWREVLKKNGGKIPQPADG